MARHRRNASTVAFALLSLAGCGRPQLSALAPSAPEAETIARLFWIMAAGAALVWVAVLAVALYSTARPRSGTRRRAMWLIVGAGVVAPTLVLGALLLYGLVLMPRLRGPAADDGPRIAVSGEQWWWRVRYQGFPGTTGEVVLANEIRLPVGERTRLLLDSPDVIHAFWIPPLGGKVDMIPGRTTELVLQPRRPGVFRGVCAEYCGTSHAHMRFAAVAMQRGAFDRWLRRQAAPARTPRSDPERRGQQAFLRNGCGACHAIRGTSARGHVGPDLTHVGSRLELAAGTLPNDAAAFRLWIADAHALKPDALMPPFAALPGTELQAMALYLDGLR